MADRIDHVAEARERLADAPQLLALDEYAKADVAVKAAQVHATLALVDRLDLIASVIEDRKAGI